jgi:hypothetical protein
VNYVSLLSALASVLPCCFWSPPVVFWLCRTKLIYYFKMHLKYIMVFYKVVWVNRPKKVLAIRSWDRAKKACVWIWVKSLTRLVNIDKQFKFDKDITGCGCCPVLLLRVWPFGPSAILLLRFLLFISDDWRLRLGVRSLHAKFLSLYGVTSEYLLFTWLWTMQMLASASINFGLLSWCQGPIMPSIAVHEAMLSWCQGSIIPTIAVHGSMLSCAKDQ